MTNEPAVATVKQINRFRMLVSVGSASTAQNPGRAATAKTTPAHADRIRHHA
ncbi:hypothetical protein MHJ85_10095 [Brevibacterium ravenspurgense]|uniref:hypothetical protein n=1 Tax=Brevibacterium ravenspurgense TaxID=479117 RepID=UPI001EF1C85F|nr:hypothetical protein [Brevibacterium ravenspurgense]MCG7301604.1 hypothetical protein [Brevibacterium ravenspurgense]